MQAGAVITYGWSHSYGVYCGRVGRVGYSRLSWSVVVVSWEPSSHEVGSKVQHMLLAVEGLIPRRISRWVRTAFCYQGSWSAIPAS